MAEKSGLTKKDSEIALKGFIETVEDGLVAGKKIAIQKFGNFETRERAARTVQAVPGKPDEGTKEIPETIVPVFKAAKALKDKVAGIED